MSNNLQKLIEYFSSIIRKYGNTNGTNDKLYLAALEFYKTGLSDWHYSTSFSGETEIDEKRKLQITNTILDFINLMKPPTIKEYFMKKSEIKSIINEVVSELYNNLTPPRKVTEAEIPKQMDGTPDWNKLDRDWETLCNKLTDKLAQQKANDVGLAGGQPNSGLDELHDAPRDGWTKFTCRDEEERKEATRIAAGNKDLENVFHMAITVAEDNGLLKSDHVAKGAYSSEKYIVEVDLHKRVYRIIKLNGDRKDLGLDLDELHHAPKDGWKKFTCQMGDEREEATKISAGNNDLENVFHTAISDGEDTAKPMDQINYGVYTSENFMVEVDLHKRVYRIIKLNGGRLTHK